MKSTAAVNTSLGNATDSARILPSRTEGVAMFTAFIFEFVFIIVGNLLTIVLFTVNRRLRKRSLYLVINMASADLMLATVALPIYVYNVGAVYQFWTGGFSRSLSNFFMVVNPFFSFVSLISAAFISAERFYAIYWPLKHRTLSMRAYRNVILMVWTFALVCAAICIALSLLTSARHTTYFWTLCTLFLIFIICACNIAIRRKFQQGSVASQQLRRASQNKRLTKTLLFVSILALLSFLPLIVMPYIIFAFQGQISWKFYNLVLILAYSNSFVNPVVYTLRIPGFREALVFCCFARLTTPNITASPASRRGNKAAPTLTSATQLSTLRTEPRHLQLALEQLEVIETKL